MDLMLIHELLTEIDCAVCEGDGCALCGHSGVHPSASKVNEMVCEFAKDADCKVAETVSERV